MATKDLTVDNTGGSSLTDYPFSFYLTAQNIDFSTLRSDGADIRVKDGATPLSYWLEEWDYVGERAKVWFKGSVGADTTKKYTLEYGIETVSAEDPTSVFTYYNALEDTADLDDLGSTFGTATWSVESDAGSPTGSCVQGLIGTANDAGRYKPLALPSGGYVVQVHAAQESGASGGWGGPLLAMSASNEWRHPGQSSSQTGQAVFMRHNAAGTPTNSYSDVKDGAQIPNSEFGKLIGVLCPSWDITGSTSIDTSTEITSPLESVVWDDTNSLVIAVGDTQIASYNRAGVVQESVENSPGGNGWGDACMHEGSLYIQKWNYPTDAKIYRFDPTDLAAGGTEVADIINDINAGVGGLGNDGSNWLVSNSDQDNAANIELYAFDDTWTLLKTQRIPAGDDIYGTQGITVVGRFMYYMSHSGMLYMCRWDAVNLEMDVVSIYDYNIDGMQSLDYNATDDEWYIADRPNNRIMVRSFSRDGTAKDVCGHWRDDTYSVSGIAVQDITPAPSTQTGIACYRTSRFSRMFVKPFSADEPIVSVTESTPGTFESNITATNADGSDATTITWNYMSAPGLDPYGHVADWMANGDTALRNTITATGGQGSQGYQSNYDGCYCYWDFANHVEGTDAQFADDLRNLAKNTIDRMVEVWPLLDASPTQTPGASAGYINYNAGMRTIVADPWFPPGDFDQYKQRTCNQARGASYSNKYGDGGVLYSRVWGDDTWPNDTTINPGLASYAWAPPILCREYALAVIGHIMADDWFADCEQRVYEGIPYTDGHDDFVARLVEDWFLYDGGAFDQWYSIDEDLRTVDGQWSLVPRAWRNGTDGQGGSIGSNYDYCPFMRAHSLRALIIHYYDDRMGTKDVKPRIVEEARRACDNWLEFWMRPSGSGRECPMYEVQGPGTSVPTSGSPDLANFLFPVAAFAWAHTGDDKYRDLAVTLIESGNADGWWQAGKQANQLMLWVYQGFQWLGWVSDPFAIWWRDNP